MNAELNTFVKESLERGLDRADIGQVLLLAGWPEDDVTNALRSFAEVDFPVPVPRPKPYFHAREAFLYLVSFIALCITAFSFGLLIFIFIESAFPDPLSYRGDFSRDSLSTAIASIVVAFPLYLFFMWRIHKTVSANPERRESLVRRWLTYLTLVVGAGIIIGDLIFLLSSFLQGELSVRFSLKALTVLIIVGVIFGYYLWDVRDEEKKEPA